MKKTMSLRTVGLAVALGLGVATLAAEIVALVLSSIVAVWVLAEIFTEREDADHLRMR